MRVILDTGPLVAFLDRGDKYHQWALQQFNQVDETVITCEAVLSEAFFLLSHIPNGRESLAGLVNPKLLDFSFSLHKHWDKVEAMILKYSDVPMSLADASLVRLSEVYTDLAVMTLDSDFKIYRRNRDQRISLIIPE